MQQSNRTAAILLSIPKCFNLLGGNGQRRIARCRSISRSTVHDYLQRAETLACHGPCRLTVKGASSKSACSADVWLGRPVIASPNQAMTRFPITSGADRTQRTQGSHPHAGTKIA
ncbi:MAG: hypothetical protein IIB38_05770 [Candidatus Hydrogenedentes bacterium]|nr:hypothetical protein [Candidatus Hydrogenedentota bacterium]